MAERGLMSDDLIRLMDRRSTLARRLGLIARGARLTYEDGTSVDMASEKGRLEDELAHIDRKIALMGSAAGQT